MSRRIDDDLSNPALPVALASNELLHNESHPKDNRSIVGACVAGHFVCVVMVMMVNRSHNLQPQPILPARDTRNDRRSSIHTESAALCRSVTNGEACKVSLSLYSLLANHSSEITNKRRPTGGRCQQHIRAKGTDLHKHITSVFE